MQWYYLTSILIITLVMLTASVIIKFKLRRYGIRKEIDRGQEEIRKVTNTHMEGLLNAMEISFCVAENMMGAEQPVQMMVRSVSEDESKRLQMIDVDI